MKIQKYFAPLILLTVISSASYAADTDGDGIDDAIDAFPLNFEADTDTDADGKPDVLNPRIINNFSTASTLEWTTDKNASAPQLWSLKSGAGRTDGAYVSSNTLAVNGVNWMQMDYTAAQPGVIKFWYRCFGTGTKSFLLDDVSAMSCSLTGSTWTSYEVNLAAGAHILKWEATGGTSGSGRLEIDDVEIFENSTLTEDDDDDNDGFVDSSDLFPLDATKAGDSDGDGVDTLADNCPSNANADQLNTDGDAQGDVCDADDDNDSVDDVSDAFPLDASESADNDGDGIGNNADPTPDGSVANFHISFLSALPPSPLWTTFGLKIGPVLGGLAKSGASAGWLAITISNSKPYTLTWDHGGVTSPVQLAVDGSAASNSGSFSVPAGMHVLRWNVFGSGMTHTFEQTLSGVHFYGLDDTDADGTPDEFDPDHADFDHDGSPNIQDNCLNISNADQLDSDGDAQGNVCDSDDDNDGLVDVSDGYPLDPTQAGDKDNDGIEGFTDNCPGNSNANQLNTDSDTQGDACDYDDDNDGVADFSDKFPLNAAASSDTDNDGFPGSWIAVCDLECQSASGLILDNCPAIANADQANSDGDAQGDVCDTDSDNDGVVDASDKFPLNAAASADVDNDGAPDSWNGACDAVCQSNSGLALDNCPTHVSNPDQLNTDGDAQGNACDDDNDNDGVVDGNDSYPFDASRSQGNSNILRHFNGDSAGDQLGISVSGAGDVNADGYADVIVGAYMDDNNGADSGSARVLSGADGSTLYTFDGESAGDYFGYSVSSAGDVNNDGYADVIVGAYQDDNNGFNSGSARVLSGADGSILYTFNGDSATDYFGFSVSGAGDVNNDGYADVIVGAYQDDNNGSNSGSARVLSGVDGSILYTFNGDSTIDYFGYAVSGAGDINNDGYTDVIVGAYRDDNNGADSGSARVLSGADGSILHTFNGDSASDYFGYSVSGAGDVNNDGYADVIVGAYQDDNNGSNSGSARVLSGADGSILYTFNGDHADDRFGQSVSGAGDVNNDGYADVIVGAYNDDNNGSASGSARVLSGADGSILYVFNGDAASDRLGYSVSGAGDVNNDGYADVIAGAYSDDNNGAASGSARIFNGKGVLLDTDHDGENDAIDNDDDADGIADISDAFPLDVDNDGVDNLRDNCVSVSNADQLNTDGDSEGNACDNDDDNDSVEDASDVFPLDATESVDTDGDGIGNNADATPNGDADNDGVDSSSDNCVSVSNASQTDTDNDGAGDACDTTPNGDSDGDGVDNNTDNCPTVSNVDQLNTDGDAQGDVCDLFPLDGELLLEQNGTAKNENFASSIAMADMNDDGVVDVLVGAPLANVVADGKTLKKAGVIRIISGKDNSILRTLNGTAANQQFGTAIAVVDDQNSDGVPDIIVGEPLVDITTTVLSKNQKLKSAGRVALYSGSDSALLNVIAEGSKAGDHFGASVAVGDLNTNGMPDLVVGAPMSDAVAKNAGQVTVFDGLSETVLYARYGYQSGEHFGAAVAVGGGILFVGSPQFDVDQADGTALKNAGHVSGYFGYEETVSGEVFAYYGGEQGDALGAAIAAAPNGDHIIGMPLTDYAGKDSGSVMLYRMVLPNVMQGTVLTGATAGDNFGGALAIQDVDNDGVLDFAIGAEKFDVNTSVEKRKSAGVKTVLLKDAGRVEVLNGAAL